MKYSSVKIRPFNVGGAFEVKLPNGKVILIDPYFTGVDFEGGFTREDVTGADYCSPTATLTTIWIWATLSKSSIPRCSAASCPRRRC